MGGDGIFDDSRQLLQKGLFAGRNVKKIEGQTVVHRREKMSLPKFDLAIAAIGDEEIDAPKDLLEGKERSYMRIRGNLHRNGSDRQPACGHEDDQVLLRGKSTKTPGPLHEIVLPIDVLTPR